MSCCVSAACGHPNSFSATVRGAAILAAIATTMAMAVATTGCATPGAALDPAAVAPEALGPEALEKSAWPAPAPSDTPTGLPDESTLDDYVAYAMRHSPDLGAAWHRWRAAAERVSQAQSLPDPQLGFGFVLDQVDASAGYMGERYSISQMFPWFGKLGLRGDVALEEAQVEARRFEAARLELVEQVTRTWFELAWLEQAVVTAAQNFELLVRLESVARTRYRVGEVSQADANRAQVELGRLEDQLRSLRDMRRPAAAQLNAVLGRPAHANLPGAFGAPSRQTPEPLPELDDAQWLALARERSPELAAAQHLVSRDRQAVSLARRDYYPDITLGLEYGRATNARMARMDGGGSDMLAGMISFSLPIRRSRIAAGIREAEARLHAATREAQVREHSLESELMQALFVHRDSVRRASLYGGTLLPKARQSLASAEAAYRAGAAGFSDLVDAQRVLLEFALAHERAAADRAQALARIRTLVGVLPEPGAKP
jgi:outer membrane protein, heavy metal efflux system